MEEVCTSFHCSFIESAFVKTAKPTPNAVSSSVKVMVVGALAGIMLPLEPSLDQGLFVF